MSSASAPQSKLPLTVGHMTVKVAAFFVLPESLLRFDAQHDQLELVLKPYAKYYYDDQRVTIIELPEHVLTFSSEAIVQRFGVLDLDLDAVAASAAATTATAAASSAATTQQTGTRSRHDTCSGSYGNAGGGGGGSSRDVRRDDTDDNSGSAIITTTTAARSSSIGGGGGGGGATSVSTNRATSYQHPPASCNVNNSQYAYPCASNSNNNNSNNSNNNSGGHAIVADATYNLDNSDGSRNTANDVNDNDASAADKAASDAAGVDAPTSALATATAATTAQQPHTFDVYFPSRADLKVILQVFTALRHRRVSCSSTRWLSPPPRMGRTHNNMAAFAVAEGEVLRHKTVNRLVGMTVGRLLCCVQLPGVTDDLRRVPSSAARIAVAVERLYRDSVRLCARAQAHAQRDTTAAAAATKQAEQQQQASNNNNKGNNNNSSSTARGRNSSGSATTTAAAAAAATTTTTMTPMSVTALQARLARGESELSVYTSLLLHYDPQHYERRVQRLFDMYPMCDQEAMAAWAHVTVAGLLSKYATRLHELMWKLCMKIGPEYGSVSPRVRYMVYRWYHKLTDDDANAVIAAAHPHEYNLLDYEPDLYMQTLVAHFGPELLPTRYNFSPIETSAQGDAPALFLHTLRCPPTAPTSTTSSGSGNNTSSGSTVRPRAVPLQMTPNERPLRMPERASSGGGGGGAPAKVHEIDLLLEKYRGDFNYMIAPLAEAVEAVVRSHEAAIHAGTSAAVAVLDAIDAANTAAAAATAAATSSSSSSSSSQHAGSSRGAEATSAAAAAGGGSSAAATTTTTATTTTAVVAAAEAVMDTVKTTSAVCDLMRVFLSRNPCGSYTAILHRMANYTFISPSSMLTGVIYLDRLCMCVPTVPLTRYFVEKLLVTAVRVASKIVDLRTVNNKNFANAFSLSTASLNAMEEALLMLMGFNCFVSPEEFYTYARRIVPPTSPMLPPPLPLAVQQQQQQQQQQHAQARAALVAADSAAVPPPLAHGNNTNNASSGSSVAGGGNARTGVYATMSAQAQQQQQPPPSSTVSSATTATTSALYAKRGLERSRTATDGVVASAATTTVASAAAAVAPMMSAPASAARERDAVVQTRLATAGSAVTSAHSSSHGGSHGDTAASPTAWQPVPPTGTRPAHAVHAPRASLVAGATNVAVTMSTMTSSNNNSSNNAAAATSAMSLQQQQQTGVAAAVGGGVAGTRSTIHGAMATTTTTNATSACSPARSGSACVGADATAVADADVSGSSVSHHSNSSSSHNYNTSNTSNHPRASHYGGEGGAGGMTYTTAAAAAATMAASVDGNGTTRMLNAAMSPARLGGAATAITGVVVTSNNGAGNGDGGGGGSSMSSIASGSNNNNTTTTAAATTAVAVATAAAAAAAAVAGSSGGGAVVYVDKMPVSTSVRSRASPHSALAHVC